MIACRAPPDTYCVVDEQLWVLPPREWAFNHVVAASRDTAIRNFHTSW